MACACMERVQSRPKVDASQTSELLSRMVTDERQIDPPEREAA